MEIGVPREIKTHEYRVGLTPDNVHALVEQGHRCWIEKDAGLAIDYSDDVYQQAGASVVDSAAEVYAQAELVVKVKEPQPMECERLRPGQVVFGFFHLAADKKLVEQLLATKAVCIAYETVTDNHGALPLLAPMSEIAGRMAVQSGIHHLENPRGGRGVLLGGVTGVLPGRVVIIGGGMVGTQAARMAAGLGADVIIIDKSIARLRELDQLFQGRIKTLAASPRNIERSVVEADLVVGAVLVSGAAAPKVIRRALLKKMKPGSVIVDVAIDQGGCCETSHPTTHEAPTFIVDDVIHYCVANIPGAVARTSTQALTNATFPYVEKQAASGFRRALLDDDGFRLGLNIFNGVVTHEVVARTFSMEWQDPKVLLEKR